mmetsp:Transcript_15497/g.29243  ORF Transcript_15497/g.29243 Transcript_15497/m.29243 type:complete len:259 (+) Transcript_15497:40-816(+)
MNQSTNMKFICIPIRNIALLLCAVIYVDAFQPYARTMQLIPSPSFQTLSSHRKQLHRLYASQNGNDDGDSILDRFLSPKIDDAGLPIADALNAQIVAPTLQVAWLSVNHAPIPTWLATIYNNNNGLLYNVPSQGALLVPTLIHGAGLAGCWLMGALAAKAYDSEAFNVSGGRGYGTVVKRIFQAGAFATGILIFSTQLDLFLEFGRYVQLGENEDTDLRLLSAVVELINDVFFEALVLSSWRLYRASLTASADGRPYE